MKTSKIFAVAALSLAALAGAHAEEYQGVIDPVSAHSRAEVRAQAVAAAHAPGQNVDPGSVVLGALSNPRDRAAVQAEAVAAAHDGTQNLDPQAFAGSQIPAYLQSGTAGSHRAAL